MPRSTPIHAPEKRAFQRSLLRWYKIHRRDLPWRKNHDSYPVLVSEFMLQQTRVETVVAYFHRFLKLFPTLESLSGAPLERVLKAWSGLGYYARARNLHAAAGIVCRDLGGKIPSSREGLLKLPGVGAYTAGAVASIAFGRPVAAVDGNVKRVIARVFASYPSRASKPDLEKFWESWIPSGKAADFNQAMMDLGATLCVPSVPRCFECPVQKICRSRGPVPGKKAVGRKPREEEWLVGLVKNECGLLLIHRNEGKKLLGGLWQFPALVLEPGSRTDGRRALQSFLLKEFGIRVRIKAELPELDYAFTHIQARVRPFLCSVSTNAGAGTSHDPLRWIKPGGLGRYPVSTLMRRIAALLRSSPGARP